MNAYQEKMLERVGDGILQAALVEESKLDAQLRKIEDLDEDDFEALRQKRRLDMQKVARQKQDWVQLGHGVYSEGKIKATGFAHCLNIIKFVVNDTKDFFNLCKKSSRVIAHFYRGVSPRCEIVDAHLDRLSKEHLETKFIKVNVEKNPFLVERLQIVLMPTIVLIKDGKTEHSILGYKITYFKFIFISIIIIDYYSYSFDEFGGTDDFTTEDVAFVLSRYGVLNFDADR